MLTVRRDFVDRAKEIAQLDSVLYTEGIEKDSVVLLHGQQGIGKTQLLAKYLRVCNFKEIRIAYVDLSQKEDYLGLIDEIVAGLGTAGFEYLDQTYDEVLVRSQVEKQTVAAERALNQLDSDVSIQPSDRSQGFVFNQPVTGIQQTFISGPVTYNDPKINYIFNIQLTEPKQVKELNQKKISQAFHDCLRTIAKNHLIAILLDHWEVATDEIKNWLNVHLLKWASELTLKKALVVLSREDLPKEFENQIGILPLTLPPFNREVAQEFWEKNELPIEIFDTLGIEIYSIPRILVMEVDKQQRLRQVNR